MPLLRVFHEDGSSVVVDSEYTHAAPTEPVFARAFLVKTTTNAPLDPALLPRGSEVTPVDLPAEDRPEAREAAARREQEARVADDEGRAEAERYEQRQDHRGKK